MKVDFALRVLVISTVGLLLTVPVSAQAKPSIPPHEKLSPLLNGKDLAGFDTLLEKQGINSDPNKVFQVEKGVLHISGQEFGIAISLTTRYERNRLISSKWAALSVHGTRRSAVAQIGRRLRR